MARSKPEYYELLLHVYAEEKQRGLWMRGKEIPSKKKIIVMLLFGEALPEGISLMILRYHGFNFKFRWNRFRFPSCMKYEFVHGPTPPTSEDEGDGDSDGDYSMV